MENEHYNRRGRSGSRASSTSSSLEVRCACQYFRSYSLLPERSALAAASRPAVKKQGLRMVQTPPAGRRLPVRCGDHEYEPIGIPPMVRMAISQHSMMSDRLAPVVKITDTDVIPVVDSDDSIDDRYRFRAQALILEGDVILPLDGRIEDNAMDGRNLGDQTIDTSADELDSPQQFQDRLEQQFQIAAQQGFVQQLTLNGAQNSSSRVDSPTPPPASGAHGFQQKLKSQAGRIRSRFKNIQKPTMPTFHMPHIRSKPSEKTSDKPSDKPFEKPSDKPSDKPSEKPSDKPSEKPSDKPSEKPSDRPSEKPPDKPPTTEAPPSPKPPPSPHQKASRMERFRMALPERPRFSLPDKSKFHLPDKSKFHLPDKSKFHLPERPKFNLPDRSKFHIKKPNIQLPKSFSKPRRTASLRVSQSPEQSQVSNTESNASTEQKKHIFDFSTFPRPKLFDRKSKAKAEYVTSSPKESRAQSTESSTFPRTKKSSLSLSARWAQRFGETRGIHDDTAVNPEHVVDRSKPWRHPSLEEPRLSLKPQTSEEEEEKLPWENTERITYDVEEVVLPEKEVEREEILYADGADIKEQEFSYDKEPVKDPRIYDDQLMKRIGTEEPKKKVRLVEDEDEGSIIDPEAEDDTTYHPRGLYDGSFPPVDPREFPQRAHSVEISEDEEEESMRSDREIQQSSGSSCERRRRGVIEEIDSDEFFLREKGISQENMRYHLISEIREALRPRADNDLPPQRPKRMRSLRKRQVESLESFDTTPPPERPKRERSSQLSLERMSTHRIVYQTEAPIAPSKNEFGSGPLDDIVVVKPVRRKSKSSLRSQSQSRLPVEEQNIVLAPLHSEIQASQLSATTPPIPRRRKRLRRDQSSSLSIRTVDSALCNGFGDAGSLPQSHERIPPTPPPTPPPLSREEEFDYLERAAARAPVPPKRTRSHSRTASLAAEDDRTSHGAESLPGDFGYADEDSLPAIPRDSSSREPSLPGYAIIEKKEKPPRPPPPRRKKQDKFATAPRPSKNGPKRPLRNYSTLRPAKSDTIRKSVDSIPFMDADYDLDHEDEDFHKDLRSGEVLSRMQARPLPAPPRPPRHKRDIHYQPEARRSLPREITPDFSETVASTQTDPLPDDLVIEEEITTAKLVVAPSRSGSQILIRTERVPSPTGESYKSVPTTPPIPPLPSHRASEQQRDIERSRIADTGESEQKLPSSTEPRRFDTSQLELLRSALFSTDEPLRIPSLEVGDLKVERLTVSQLEAYKVAASEIDAIVVSATEMSNKSETEGGIHPSLLQELIAIRNQLEAVAASQPQSRPQSAMEDASTATSNERIDAALDELARSSEKQLFEIKRSFSRESSPLLVVQRSTPEKEAIDILGRTVLPQSSSITDLTSTSDSPTVVSEIQASLILTDTVEEPLITVVEPPTDEHLPSMDEPAKTPSIARETTTTTTTMTTTTTSELPVTTRSTSRSRSSSPSRGPPGAVRQTASPVKSLPPVISVTLDSITSTTLDNNNCSMPLRHVTSSGVQPQRAVISYQTSYEDSPKSSPHPSRETSQSPPPPPTSSPARESSRSPPTICDSPQPPQIHTQYIAFPTSQIPPEFFSLANPPLSSSTTDLQNQQVRRDVEVEPSIAEMTSQLMRALRLAGTRSLRHFVDSVVSRFGSEEEAAVADTPDVKVRRVELAVCALLILIASLIIIVICNPRTVTHHHHWDYFNPPQ